MTAIGGIEIARAVTPQRVVVIGAGYVGLVTAVGLAACGHRVHIVEQSADRAGAVAAGRPDFHEPGLPELVAEVLADRRLTVATAFPEGEWDLVMVAVGTGTTSHDGVDLTHIEGAFDEVMRSGVSHRAVVVRSTVPVGFCDRMAARMAGMPVASNPEYLQEGQALRQFLRPDRIVIGARDRDATLLMTRLYEPFDAPLVIVDPATAELSKLAANTYLGVRLSFINEVANVAELTGVDVDQVAHIVGFDPRIGHAYLRAGLGFGGSCLPKDMALFADIARSSGAMPRLVDAATAINEERIVRLVARAKSAGFEPVGARVAVLGLAFKPDTDDARKSPGVELARALTAFGSHVVAHDPLITPATAAVLGIEAVADRAEAVKDADAVFLTLDAREYLAMDLSALRLAMRGDLIVDGRGVTNASACVAAGLRYVALGRPGAPEFEREGGVADRVVVAGDRVPTRPTLSPEGPGRGRT